MRRLTAAGADAAAERGRGAKCDCGELQGRAGYQRGDGAARGLGVGEWWWRDGNRDGGGERSKLENRAESRKTIEESTTYHKDGCGLLTAFI